MQIIDIINGAIEQKKSRFTFELLPPLKGDSLDSTFSAIDTLVEFDPAYINVTNQREVVKYVERGEGLVERRVYRHRPGTVGVTAAIMKRYGIEVVAHMICGGISRYDIEDALIDLDFLGIHNVLALRGDNLSDEKGFVPHPKGHANADQLVRQIVDMNNGIYLDAEVEKSHRSRFCIGVAGYPEKHAESPNLETDIEYLKKKIESGAEYIVTQMSYDNDKILSFIDSCRAAGITVPIIPGIKPLSTLSHLTVLPRIFRVDLPQALVCEAVRCKDNKQVRELGIEWATEQARGLKKAGLPIIHFYTMGRTDNVARIVRDVF